MTIRQTIITRLAKSGRSRYWLAKTAGVSESVVKVYCDGTRDVTTETADKLIAALAKAKRLVLPRKGY